jgi:hypothetical protein
MAVRDSQPLGLLPATSVSSTQLTPQGVIGSLKGIVDLFLGFNCSAVPVGGSPVLDAFLITSLDGVVWQDIAHVQFKLATGIQYVQVAGETPAPQSIVAAQFATLPAGQVVQGPWGDRLAVVWNFTAGGSAGSYTLAVQGYGK